MSDKRGRGRPARDGDPADYIAFTVRIPAVLHRRLGMIAARDRKSLNDLTTKALEDWWARQPDRREFERLVPDEK